MLIADFSFIWIRSSGICPIEKREGGKKKERQTDNVLIKRKEKPQAHATLNAREHLYCCESERRWRRLVGAFNV